MGFPMVPKSATLIELERRNGPYFALFHRIRQFVGADYVKAVEDRPTLSATKMQPRESSYSDIVYGNIRGGHRERVHCYI